MFDLKALAKDANKTQTEIGDIIGVDQSQVSFMMRGRRAVLPEHIKLLAENLPHMNIAKYYTPDIPAAIMTPVVEDVAETVEGINEEASNVVTIEQPPLVPDNIVRKPEVDILEWADNADNEHTQNAFNIANILKRTRFIIKMNNSAMLPTLSQTDFLFLKPFADGSEIIDGEIYGIETRAWGILIRHLYNDGDYILARPKNTLEYGDIRIPKKDVRNKYHIVFRGSTSLSSTPNNEAEHIKQLQRQGEHITSLIDEVVNSGKRQDRLISMLEKKQ